MNVGEERRVVRRVRTNRVGGGVAALAELPAAASAARPAGSRVEWKRARRALIRRGLMLADLAGLVTSLALAQAVWPGDGPQRALAAAAVVGGWFVLAGVYGLYSGARVCTDNATIDEIWPIFHASTVGAWIVFALGRAGDSLRVDVGRLVALWLAAILILPLTRAAARVVMRRRLAFRQRTVVVGAGLVGQELARKIRRNPAYGMDVVGFVDPDPLPLHGDLTGVPVLGGTTDLARIVEQHGVDHVLLAFTGDGHEIGLDIVRECNGLDVDVDVVPRLFEVVGSRAQFHSLQGTPLLGLTKPVLGTSHRIAKRAIDVAASGLGLLVLSPVMLAIAAAIKLTSPGPVFFRQERIGRGQTPFTIFKFRTMVADAEARKAEVAHLNAHLDLGDARMFKIPDDPRVTRVGKVLRKTSLDELPQLINVLRGDMSLVGPRPLIRDEHQYVSSWGLRRLDLTPGLTGLWQVCGRSEVPFAQMLVLDYLYVTNWSLWGDITLVLRTFPVLFGKTRGAS